MKKARLTFAAVLFTCFGLLGCATPRPFSNDIVNAIGQERIPDFQYYISEGIFLSRNDTEREEQMSVADVRGGTAVIRMGTAMDEKYLEASTRCIVERDDNRDYETNEYGEGRYLMRVGFEQLDDGTIPKVLFATRFEVNPSLSDRYYLVYDSENNKIEYNGYAYDITLVDGKTIDSSNVPYLNIKIRVSDTQEKTRRRIRGLRVQ